MLRHVGSYQHITFLFIFRTYCYNYVDESNKIKKIKPCSFKGMHQIQWTGARFDKGREFETFWFPQAITYLVCPLKFVEAVFHNICDVD